MAEEAATEVCRYAQASRARVIIDADDYFAALQAAMLRARRRIVLIGWDFDTRIRITGGRRWWQGRRRAVYPARFGAFIVWLSARHPRLNVYVLRWNFGALKFLIRGWMAYDLIRWGWNRAIHYRLDAAHPFGASQHQKLVVLDDRVAACGGIDMTNDRWDTTAHLDDDPRRRRSISGRSRRPWHDLAILVEGDAAAALGAVAGERWAMAAGHPLAPCTPTRHTPWPPGLAADFSNVEIGIARTRAAWRGTGEVREVEAVFLAHIARARRFIYIESQYFASRRIAGAIAARLAEAAPPEIVLVTAARAVTSLQRLAMDGARGRLLRALAGVDHAGRLHVFVPLTAGGRPIYVHSKLMIVDDEVLRVGSANLNNRSMGLDTECDVSIDAARPGNADAAPAIARLRRRLLAEHCGVSAAWVARRLGRGETMAEVVAAAPRDAKRLEVFRLPALSPLRQRIADAGWLDPETPGQVFARGSGRLGLFDGIGLCAVQPDKGTKDTP